jgi:protein-tyrosine phosphatase
MAHPERNLALQRRPERVAELREAGLLLQLTATCFTRHGRKAHTADKLAWELLRQGHACVIASDAHDTKARPPALAEAYRAIRAEWGEAVCEQLMANANAIWADAPCHPVQITSTRRWSIPLFSRRRP